MPPALAWFAKTQTLTTIAISRIGKRRLAVGAILAVAFLPAIRLIFLTAALSYHVSQLQQLADNPSPTALVSAGGTIRAARWDIVGLRNEAGFILRWGPALERAPLIGPDLVYANALLDMAANMLIAADETCQGLSPIMAAAGSESVNPLPHEVLDHLVAAEPRFSAALAAARSAEELRAGIPYEQLSPIGRRLIDKTDRVLILLKQGVAAINLAPALLGADGPKSYLMIIQNQDELRATGGFVSAAGILEIEDGDIKSLSIQDSYAVGNYAIPQPYEPLAKYMAADYLVFRDANWSADFPTAAAELMNLYQGDHPEQAIDGVIALDQTAISILLKATGPISVRDVPEPITSDNLVAYMRSSWSAQPGEGVSYDWWLQRKDFMQNMAGSLLQSLRHASWAALGQAGTQALRQKHILIWLNDEPAASILQEQGWNGALRPGAGDYLYVVESNVGFNKVNAVVQRRLEYSVDLSDPAAPGAQVSLSHFNPAKGEPPCLHKPDYGSGAYEELINRCYWNYLRVFAPAGVRNVTATLVDLPAEWSITGQTIPGSLDTDSTRPDIAGFGTLTIVPFGAAATTSFQYQLPASVLDIAGAEATYSLLIQKQPGTPETLTDISITFPAGASFVSASVEGTSTGNLWTWRALLEEDTVIRVKFSLN